MLDRSQLRAAWTEEIAGYGFSNVGGYWNCADHGFFTTDEVAEWTPGRTPVCPHPDCNRADTIQWCQVSIAKSAAKKLGAAEQEVERLRESLKDIEATMAAGRATNGYAARAYRCARAALEDK